MINQSDMTIVLQGSIPYLGSEAYARFSSDVSITRTAFPRANIILSTWESDIVPPGLPVDGVVHSTDPGSQISFKKNSPSVRNNGNRQLVSTVSGLLMAKTKYSLKLRNDFSLKNDAILHAYERWGINPSGRSRIIAPSLFTVDPRFTESMSFHLSDWLQFGTTEQMLEMWSAPLISKVDSAYYDHNAHAKASKSLSRRYRSKFAIEQHTCIHYAKSLGYDTPEFHNDLKGEILESHDRFIRDETLILNPDQMGLNFTKYKWASRSAFQRINCITFLDWVALQSTNNLSLEEFASLATNRWKTKNRIIKAAKKIDNLVPIINSKISKVALSPLFRSYLKTNQSCGVY